jgi:hypothetical protein
MPRTIEQRGGSCYGLLDKPEGVSNNSPAINALQREYDMLDAKTLLTYENSHQHFTNMAVHLNELKNQLRDDDPYKYYTDYIIRIININSERLKSELYIKYIINALIYIYKDNRRMNRKHKEMVIRDNIVRILMKILDLFLPIRQSFAYRGILNKNVIKNFIIPNRNKILELYEKSLRQPLVGQDAIDFENLINNAKKPFDAHTPRQAGGRIKYRKSRKSKTRKSKTRKSKKARK